jgi:hypothetical protein
MCEGRSYHSLTYFGGSFVPGAVISVDWRPGGPGSGGRLCLPFAEVQNGSLAEARRACSTSCLAASHPTLPRFAIYPSRSTSITAPLAHTGRSALGITTILQEVNPSLLDRFTLWSRSPSLLHNIIELIRDGSLYYHPGPRSWACL